MTSTESYGNGKHSRLPSKDPNISNSSNGYRKTGLEQKITDEEIRMSRESKRKSLSADEKVKIRGLLRKLSYRGVTITNCLFDTVNNCKVEVWYVSDGQEQCCSNDEELLAKLSVEISVPKDEIKLVRLRQKPEYRSTAYCPGDAVEASDKKVRAIGAFVDVSGLGTHALLAGHGLQVNDEIEQSNGQLLGRITDVCLSGPDDLETCDAALSTVENSVSVENSIATTYLGSTRLRHLTSPPVDCQSIAPKCQVQKFNRNPNDVTSSVYSRHFVSFTPPINHCIAVEQFHGPGESGTIITSKPRPSRRSVPEEDHVDPYGILIGECNMIPVEGRAHNFSIAVPLDRTLSKLEQQKGNRKITLKDGRLRSTYVQEVGN